MSDMVTSSKSLTELAEQLRVVLRGFDHRRGAASRKARDDAAQRGSTEEYEREPRSAVAADCEERLLTFEVGRSLYALPIAGVIEVAEVGRPRLHSEPADDRWAAW